MGLRYLPDDSDVAFVAFNRHIAQEMSERMQGEGYHISTFHSLGYKAIRDAIGGKIKVDGGKLWWIIKDNYWDHSYESNVVIEYNKAVQRLVSLCKGTLREPSDENLTWLSSRYNIEMGASDSAQRFVSNAVRTVYDLSVREALDGRRIDYDDMIDLVARGLVPPIQFDALMVDEAQDLNTAQVEFGLRSVREGGRIIACGDPYQSIYSFRGADPEAIPRLIEALDAEVLPLSVCYRCPTSHIALAQQLVPHIEAAPGAIEGVVGEVGWGEFLVNVEVGDVALCRTNAPLIKPAFSLIKSGVKAVILGRKIGEGLIAVVRKAKKKYRVGTLSELMSKLEADMREQARKAYDKGEDRKAMGVEDRLDTILALAEGSGAGSVEELIGYIDSLFSDDRAAVTLSTIHKFKGGQAERVWLLRSDLVPHPRAVQDWQVKEEGNLKLVWLTRSQREMYFVRGGR
jgi:DNA helicase-2/ATP-dependent DNA helicase PcrA